MAITDHLVISEPVDQSADAAFAESPTRAETDASWHVRDHDGLVHRVGLEQPVGVVWADAVFDAEASPIERN